MFAIWQKAENLFIPLQTYMRSYSSISSAKSTNEDTSECARRNIAEQQLVCCEYIVHEICKEIKHNDVIFENSSIM